jgi:DNA-binding NarL/FixJ family response regulator
MHMEKSTRRPEPRSPRERLPEDARLKKKIRILLAGELTLVRDALRFLINSQRDMEVVAEVSDAGKAVERALPVNPDVAVLDLFLPPLSSLTIARALLRDYPGIKLVVLAGHEEKDGFTELVRAKVCGYLFKDSTGEELLQAIRKAASGGVYFVSGVKTRAQHRQFAGVSGDGRNARRSLTTREETVLRLVALGHTNKEIAAKLSLSPKTVEAHKFRIGKKLGKKGRVTMVRYALRRGWLAEEAVFSAPG